MEENEKKLSEQEMEMIKDMAKTKVEISDIIAECKAEVAKK